MHSWINPRQNNDGNCADNSDEQSGYRRSNDGESHDNDAVKNNQNRSLRKS